MMILDSVSPMSLGLTAVAAFAYVWPALRVAGHSAWVTRFWVALAWLTHGALLQEQRSRIGDAMRLAQSVAPGVIDGLEVAIEPLRSADGRAGAALAIGTGHAIAPDGQDLHLTYPLRVDADRILVWTGDPRAPTLGQRRADAALRTGLTHAMVLVARPLTMVIDRLGGGNDPCVNATEPELNPALAWEDGFQLAWVPWPADRPLPPWQTPQPPQPPQPGPFAWPVRRPRRS
jgi:hypothetical protein